MHLKTSVQLERPRSHTGLLSAGSSPPAHWKHNPEQLLLRSWRPLGEGQDEGGNTSTLVLQIKPLCFDYFTPERGKSMLYPYRWLENQMLYAGHSSQSMIHT